MKISVSSSNNLSSPNTCTQMGRTVLGSRPVRFQDDLKTLDTFKHPCLQKERAIISVSNCSGNCTKQMLRFPSSVTPCYYSSSSSMLASTKNAHVNIRMNTYIYIYIIAQMFVRERKVISRMHENTMSRGYLCMIRNKILSLFLFFFGGWEV